VLHRELEKKITSQFPKMLMKLLASLRFRWLLDEERKATIHHLQGADKSPQKDWFWAHHQKGSHFTLKRSSDNFELLFLFIRGNDLRGSLKDILGDAGLSKKELNELL